MPIELSDPKIVWGFIGLAGTVAFVLRQLGLFHITLGRPGKDEPPTRPIAIGECPDPGCHKTVEQIGEDVEHLCEAVEKDIFPKINRTAEAVARIEGYIQGQQGHKS